MYTRAFPALPSLTDPQAQQDLTAHRARAIDVGTPLDVALLHEAQLERQARENYARLHPERLSVEERMHAVVRCHGITHDHAVHAYPVRPRPRLALLPQDSRTWSDIDAYVASTQAILQDSLQEVRDDVDDVLRGLYELQNVHRKRLNTQTMLNSRKLGVHQLLRPYVKARPDGAGFPGGPSVERLDIAMGQKLPPSVFPATIELLKDMSEQQIQRLAIALDETFGITEEDAIETMRAKVTAFLLL
ncbi:hypothetical protein Poli38472_001597 [Pythium oligandrum]|uniref:Uncharacterized protein n=1 Tax=Pythium oligandrum TaxID=41045 RepID=A0A8K1CT95_PYTOL|nr:hypothetical protein Poli38472_001597 [Pythium oligandrum]|eukprot:TMW69441.1 hypothetical protein Poli38472_001597 [Pythium oligandrum]